MRQLFALLLCVVAWPAWGSTCTIGIYAGAQSVTDGVVGVALSLLDTIEVTFTTASVESAEFPGGTSLIRVKCVIDSAGAARWLIDDDPTATQDDQWIADGETEYFGASGGQRIAFINKT